MKVLLVCIALAIECYAEVETTNSTTTSTLETPEFESSERVHRIKTSTKSTIYDATTEITPSINDSSDKSVITKKKPFIRLRKQKKFSKSNSRNGDTYKVWENEDENSEQKSKFVENLQFSVANRPRLNSSGINYKRMKIPHGKPSFNEFQRDESRVISSYRFPENSVEIMNENPRNMEFSEKNNFYRVQENPFENIESKELFFEDSGPKNPFQYESESQAFTNNMRNELAFEQFNYQHQGERPSLPDINNVIHKVNTEENTDSYKSPKGNHIVEVNKVPIVFEHHYQGDYKNPEMQFVAHQYSYSPPADNTNEAYQLGKILSQNVVQKLQSAQKPLEEFVEDKQEVTLNIPMHATSSFSQQNYDETPRGRYFGSQFLHPLVKHLAPEMSHNDVNRDNRNFQNANTNAYQIVIPKAQMHPIVVEDEPIRPVYETTYLSAIQTPQFENNYQQPISQQYRTNSPYSLNVQQDFIDVPKYTLMSFFNLQDRVKPEAIHEVDPPNLARWNNFRNIHTLRNRAPPTLSAIRSQLLRNPEYRAKSPTEQHHKEENPPPKWRSGIEIIKHQFAKYIQPNPTAVSNLAASFAQNPRTQMIQSRPYWRKPQIMKLVRLPENYQQVEQEYQPQQHQEQNIQENLNVEDNTQVSHNHNNHQYSTEQSQLIESNESSPINQHIPDQHSGNIIHLVSQHQPTQSNIQHQFSDSNQPSSQQVFNFDKQQPQEKPKNIYFTQEPFENQVIEENPRQYTDTTKNTYQSEIYHNKQPNIRTEVQIVKSVSPQYFQSPHYESIRYNSDYTKPRVEDETLSVELPKGYLNDQDQKSTWRTLSANKAMNTRHIVQLEKPKLREINGNLKSYNINPYSRLRRVASGVSGPNIERRSYLVLMQEDDDR